MKIGQLGHYLYGRGTEEMFSKQFGKNFRTTIKIMNIKLRNFEKYYSYFLIHKKS